jgi:hypothetical protein
MPVALIAVAAVAAAGAAGSAAIKGNAKRKALNGQIDALKELNDIDPEAYANLAKQGDIDAWKTRLDTMRKVDPQLAEIRDSSLKSFTTMLAKNASDSNRSDDVAQMVYGLAQQFAAGAPAEMDLGTAFTNKAREKLGRGSQLPPTYQAELIRSGLETAGAAGVGASRQGPVAGVLGRLLGSAAMNVERQNEQDAMTLAQAGSQLSSSRLNILQGLIPQFQNYEQAKTNLAAQGLAAVNQETPSKIGLAGADLVNLTETARRERNLGIQKVAELEGQKALAAGEMKAGFVQAGSQFAQSVIGGLAGGGGGGAAGGGGNVLGGLMQGGGQSIPILGGRGSQNLGYGGYIGAGSYGQPAVVRSPQNQILFDQAGQEWQ